MNKFRRHGDIILTQIPPNEAAKLELPSSKETVLAYGEVTGHAHRVNSGASVAILPKPSGNVSILRVDKTFANLTHEEHKTLSLPQGDYAFTQKRQYSDSAQGWEKVVD